MTIHMSFARCSRFFSPALVFRNHAYSSLNRRTSHSKLPFNFFSITSMASAASVGTAQFPVTPYTPTYDTWPYNPSDFTRYDENDDGVFYRQPRLVTHIDDPSIARLTEYYATVLPKLGKIMDMCTSWKSFYPRETEQAVQNQALEIYGVGLNAEEMELNGALKEWRVLDLNQSPHDVREGWKDDKGLRFDAVTCVVSIDYLVKPLEICRNLLDAMNEGGKVHLVISNRCFPNKVVRRWMTLSEQARLELVGDYLHFAGWSDVEIVDLCAKDDSGMRVTDDHGTVLIRSPHLPDHLDPLWVVRGTKRTGM
ncbi:hypothetical protein BDU57DRAFT_514961 [Ampelomyces quisqualis]|uniref:S-adenosyl-L-methionine-dependent methyltransferase n=1 Tax=Ampelomyces quisqualis TaxID=50730 RepID=A0A6A5QWM8_AMPQU|nr:hypothetical protein BDU57DRAFT_514961 [Ampelomyces quisqualis]